MASGTLRPPRPGEELPEGVGEVFGVIELDEEIDVSEPKVGDVYVRKADRISLTVTQVVPDADPKNPTVVWLTPELTRGAIAVNANALAAEFERQESVREAAERGFRPLMEGGR